MRRFIRQSADFAKWTLVIALVTATLLLLAGRLIVNQLGLYQPRIEDWLGSYLQVPVSVDSVAGDWQGALPRIQLESAAVGGEAAFLSMQRMELEPDWLQSVLHRTLVVREMQIQGLEFALQENGEGQWHLGSLRNTGQAGSQLRAQLLDSIMRSGRILVRDAQVRLLFFDGNEIALSLDEIQIENADDFHRFEAQALVGGSDNQVELIAEFGARVAEADGATGRAYLSLSGARLNEPLASFLSAENGPVEASTEDISLSAELWFDLFPDWHADFSGDLALGSVPINAGDEDAIHVDFRAATAGSISLRGDLRFDFIRPALVLDGRELEIFDFGLRQDFSEDSRELVLAVSRLALGDIYRRANDYGLLSGRLAEVLAELRPEGALNHLRVQFDPLAPIETLQLRGNLEGVNLESFVRAPSVRNLSGYFEASAFEGFVQIDAEDVAPHYEGVYERAFSHDRMRGTVAWSVDPDRHAVEVFSSNLEIQGTQGSIGGAFRVEAPSRPGAFPTDLIIAIGLTDSAVEHWRSLVPYTAPEGVHTWLDRYADIGRVPEASFLFRGLLQQGSELRRTIQLRLALADTDLGYAQGWPALEGVEAELVVDNREISVVAGEAQITGIDVSGARINIDTRAPGQIAISTAFLGPGNAVLDLLRSTPARGGVGAGLDEFDLQGEISGQVELTFPLASRFPRDQLQADIGAELRRNTLNLPSRRLSITQLQGMLHYDDAGLWSDQLSGLLWSEPVDLEIQTTDSIEVDLRTWVEMAQLRDWLGADILEPVRGRSEVEGLLRVGATDTSYEFHSSLTGVSSALPAPLGKAEDEPLALEVTGEAARGEESTLTVQLGERLGVTARRAASGQLLGASLGLNASAPAISAGQLNGVVSMESLDIEEWTQFLSAGSTGESPFSRLSPHIEIAAQQTRLGLRDLGSIHALLSREANDWLVDFAATWGQGIYRVSALGNEVPELSFHELNLSDWNERAEPAGESDPREIPPLRVRIDELIFAERTFGSWQFVIQPREDGIELVDLSANKGDIRVIGAEQASRLIWTYDGEQHLTQMDLSLGFGDAAEIFQLINQPPAVSSESGSFYGSFSWQGKPAEVMDVPLSGVMGVRLQDGEFDTQVEGVGNALMRVVGLFNINTWARRLQFDFSDFTARGTQYDSMRGDLVLDGGVLTTLTPVDARLASGRMRFDGRLDLNEGSVDAQLVATLPLRENMTWMAGLVAGLPAAAGVWLIGKLFESEVDNLTSVSYHISGSIDDPDVRTERVFESTIGD